MKLARRTKIAWSVLCIYTLFLFILPASAREIGTREIGTVFFASFSSFIVLGALIWLLTCGTVWLWKDSRAWQLSRLLSLPLQNVPLGRAIKLRRENEAGKDTSEGLHA